MSFAPTVLVACCLSLLTLLIPTESARILGIVAIPSYSHQVGPRALWRALTEHGHEVVVITSDPMRDKSIKNLTEIDFSSGYDIIRRIDFNKKRFTSTFLELQANEVSQMGHDISVGIFELPEVKKLYAPNSQEKFDLVIAEILITPALYALAHRFDAPLIGIASLEIRAINYYLLGGPILPSHPSAWEMEDSVGYGLTFWQRLNNFLAMWKYIYTALNNFFPAQQKIAEKYLGEGLPYVADLERRMSLVLVNQDWVTGYARPTLPNIVEFTGTHISPVQKPLRQDLKSFLDNAPNGFIYLSLGTNVRFSSFPSNVKAIFREVLRELPYRILWKADEKELGDGLDNVRVEPWLPQQSVLAHPKIKLFVYQGGHQSTEEALYNAVPMVGIPMLADQAYQVNRLVHLEVARRVEVINISKDALLDAIKDVLSNKKYKENMIRLSKLAQDKPVNVTENAVWWLEYVIRHKGATHLRCSIAFESWYQRYDLDVIIALVVVSFVAAIVVLAAVVTALSYLTRSWSNSAAKSKEKRN